MIYSMIKALSLCKKFGDFCAVDNLSLEIKQGECFGLLGPNGAGKSTFIGMTYGAVERSAGDLTVFGIDPKKNSREIKKRMGVVTQENALDESLSVMENMLIYSAFIGVPSHERNKRVMDLLEYMNIAHKKDEPILALSGGMKRRLVFVRALLGKPELLILDEPTTGLDPAVRHLLWGKVKELHQNGTTIVITTHYMHEAEVLCDRLIIMNKGKISGEGSPQDLIKQHTPGYVGIYNSSAAEKLKGFSEQNKFDYVEDASGIYLRAPKMADLLSSEVEALQLRPANLEDVFLKLTGKELSVDA